MKIDQIEKGIEKTGYRLEFDISSILTKNGWNVINNKYYVDDQQETVREIDIVAYKASSVYGLHVYTALILSCKKNEKNVWALLSKKSEHKDPNMEWVPVHAWSNDRVLNFMLNEQSWKNEYISLLEKNGEEIVSSKPTRHVFGFQEMNRESGAPQNDKNIFNSITSLMKAQAYEMNALPVRKKEPCVFQFNLLSIAKTELVRLSFSSEIVKGEEIEDEIYVAGYIVDKQQTFAKVHFIQSNKFEQVLQQYNNLHNANVKAFKKIHDNFFQKIVEDYKKLALFKKDLANDLWLPVYQALENQSGVSDIFKNCWLYWDKENKVIECQVDLTDKQIAFLNSKNSLRKDLSKALKKYYKYEGNSRYATNDDIPF